MFNQVFLITFRSLLAFAWPQTLRHARWKRTLHPGPPNNQDTTGAMIYADIYKEVDNTRYIGKGGIPCDVVVNVPDGDIVGSQFELQSRYYVHFRTDTFEKGIQPLFPYVVLLLFLYSDGFGLK